MQVSDGPGALVGVVAVGASAGGVEALSQLAAGLSEDLPYAFLVTLHMPAGAPSILASIIDRAGPLPATTAEDGAKLLPANIYVARPNYHLLVANDRLALSKGPAENGHRPAINALFCSVAVAFGPRTIGVLLSGLLDDGVAGLEAIRARGGITIGQTPDDAQYPGLPTSASDAGVVDHQITAAGIGAALAEFAQRDIGRLPPGGSPTRRGA